MIPPACKPKAEQAAPAAAAGFVAEALDPRSLLSVFGIDVSHWQGSIDWAQVRGAGKEFAFAKASEGTGFVDSRFASNMANGRAAGVLVGAYHFARPDTGNTGAAEARHFVNTIRPYLNSGHLRPALDLEVGAGLGKAALSAWVHDFMAEVRNSTGGVEPLIYVNTNYATNYLETSVNRYDLWVANWGPNDGQYHPDRQPGTGVWASAGGYDFWQYTSTGSVAGIAGRVDLDVFDGDRAALERFKIDAIAGDRFEANDSFATAANLGALGDRVEQNLTIHSPANDDYFRFTAASAGTLNISFAFSHAQGDVDAFLYNGSQTEIDRSDGNTNAETLSAQVAAGQTYYLKVVGYNGATSPDYDVTFDGPPRSSPCPRPTRPRPRPRATAARSCSRATARPRRRWPWRTPSPARRPTGRTSTRCPAPRRSPPVRRR